MAFKDNKQISSRNSQNIQIKGRTIDSKGQDGAEYGESASIYNFVTLL